MKTKKTISMISSLPPVIGVSDYTLGLIKSLRKYYHIHFIGLRTPYPKLIFPGQIYDHPPEHNNQTF